jgi:multidrug efflux system outer membrane protein
MKNTMIKPVIHTALAAAVATLLSACGTIGPNFMAPKGVETPAYRHAEAAPQQDPQLARLRACRPTGGPCSATRP